MLYEMFVLVKHSGFTREDILFMPIYERKIHLEFLIEEAENRKKQIEEQRNKSTN